MKLQQREILYTRAKAGPVIIVEDDLNDQHIPDKIFQDLEIRNRRCFFETCQEVTYENELLRKKAFPFIFYTTTAKKEAVDRSYEWMVQDYWRVCFHPNSNELA
jgi:hypothetical protein